jgi:alpha-glucoside transport system substrate-binding protein
VVAVWTGVEQANFERVLRRFEEDTGAEVRFTSTGSDIATALGFRLDHGEPPDVAVLPQPGLLQDLARRGAIRPIEDVAGDLVDRNYPRVWRSLASVGRALYGVWFKAANKSIVWYRTEAFFDARVPPPKTWPKLREVADKVASEGMTPLAVGGADGWTLTDWFENVYLRSAGPEKYDQLSRHEIPWTDPSVKEALRTLGQVLGRHEWLVGGAEGALRTTFEESVIQTFGDPPQAAMTFEADFVAVNIRRNTRAEVGTEARFFDFPSIRETKRSLVVGGDVAVLLKDSPAARALIRFLATPRAAEPWAEMGGFSSPNTEVHPAAYPDLPSRQLARTLRLAELVRFDLSDLVPPEFGARSEKGMRRILQDWLKNPHDIDGTAARLEEAAAAADGPSIAPW